MRDRICSVSNFCFCFKSSKFRNFMKSSPIELKIGMNLIFCAVSMILKAKIKKVKSFGAIRVQFQA